MVFNHTLPNGVRIVGQKLPYFHSVSIGAWVGVGSAKETQNEAGISHFIEHMLFKGTTTKSASDIASQMDELGAQINAFTSKECTCYYVKATDDHLEKVTEMLGDIILNSVFDPTEISKEQGVVIEEISMVEDSPEDLVMEMTSEQFYKDHPLGKPILGTAQSVSSFTQSDLKAYMAKHYVAQNILIAIAGNFEEQQIINYVEKYFDLPKSTYNIDYPAVPAFQPKAISSAKKDIEQVHICLAAPGFGAQEDDFYPLLVVNNAFGGNMSSRLFQKIREQEGLAYTVYSYTSSYRQNGSLGMYAGTSSATAVQVVELMIAQIELLKRNGITQEELQRSKNQLKGSYILGSESTGSRMSSIGKSMLLNNIIRSEEEIIEKIEAVKEEHLQAVIEKCFDFEKLCGCFVGRVEENAEEFKNLW